MPQILHLDLEVNLTTKKIEEIGFILGNNEYRGRAIAPLQNALAQAKFLCGHNLYDHDLPALQNDARLAELPPIPVIDTLYLSALLHPERKSHSLDKDYQLSTPHRNDPLADARLTRDLLGDLRNRWESLSKFKKAIFILILADTEPFRGFFQLVRPVSQDATDFARVMQSEYEGQLCSHARFEAIRNKFPLELAFVLALLDTPDPTIRTPSWLLHRYPKVNPVFAALRSENCEKPDCQYCAVKLDPKIALREFFGFTEFRRFEGDGEMPLQEKAVRAALKNEPLIAIFPTGGGKSLTYQLPALIRGKAKGALTVVISPLVALMKDQVDGLLRKNIVSAVAINGLLDPLSRSEAIRKVEDGMVNILYISPESLRSYSMLRLLKGRLIDRFVIDEAHCFSAWGQDFRVEYLYIGHFIKRLQVAQCASQPIPVSCFTATARPQVVRDIRRYFQQTLQVNLNIYQTHQQRQNLTYSATELTEEEKFGRLVELLQDNAGPAIVYVSRVKKSLELAQALQRRGFRAGAYNGKMDSQAKNRVQDAFAEESTRIIVATSAFGMGVDKDNVGTVIHYEISNSLENYVQEAGRAGRDPKIKANCVILFNEEDLNKHFALLQGLKLTQKEISQIWRGIKRFRDDRVRKSALEIAKSAGWDVDMQDLETRVKTALNALEHAGYLERDFNAPRIFSSGLIYRNLQDSMGVVRDNAAKFTPKQRDQVPRILQFIYGKGETRVDYMSERLGIPKSEVTTLLNLLKQVGVLTDDADITAQVDERRSEHNSERTLKRAIKLEKALLKWLNPNNDRTDRTVTLREANGAMEDLKIESSVPQILTLLRFWEWRKYLRKERLEKSSETYRLRFRQTLSELVEDADIRHDFARRILKTMLQLPATDTETDNARIKNIEFSVNEIRQKTEFGVMMQRKAELRDYEQHILYLHTVQAIELKKGMLIYYNRLTIERKETNNLKDYTKPDYRQLSNFYQKKVEQVHIVGEYAKRLMRNYTEAMEYVEDYFRLEYKDFLRKYFPQRKQTIQQPLTEKKFAEIFAGLNLEQTKVVQDGKHQQILVAAGPGSGKTRVLVHKMASLLLLEDIKPDQFLMLAFSRPAANEFRTRLQKLVPGLGHHVDIFTYHGFAFRLLGRRGDLERSGDILTLATEAIRDMKVPFEKVAGKSVVMLDEFQDISKSEYEFLQALLEAAGDVRVVAAGDDDQSIYTFRGASVKYMQALVQKPNSAQYFLSRNYRSRRNIVEFSNLFLEYLPKDQRIKKDQILVPEQKKNGNIHLHRYSSGHLIPTFIKRFSYLWLKGNTAILTATNEEALQITTLLRQIDIPAVLVASRDGFAIHKLAEIQSFTTQILRVAEQEHGFIPNEIWQQALSDLRENYARSSNLDLVQRMAQAFETEFDKKYKGDWLEYIRNTRQEDFYFPERNSILVSTMHKAKGKEFDNVFVLLDGYDLRRDEAKRAVYVAITRAKNRLEIHTNRPYFDDIKVKGMRTRRLEGSEAPAGTLVLSCGMQDVVLNVYKQPAMSVILETMRAGEPLQVARGWRLSLRNEAGQPVVIFSKKFQERLEHYRMKGYEIAEVRVEHLVWWRGKDEEESCLVLLPQVVLGRGEIPALSE